MEQISIIIQFKNFNQLSPIAEQPFSQIFPYFYDGS